MSDTRKVIGTAALVLVLLVAPVSPAHGIAPAQEQPAPPVDLMTWHQFHTGVGTFEGVAPQGNGGLAITQPMAAVEHAAAGAGPYELGRWTSPPHRPGFDATELVASWNAHTPPGTWLKIEMRGDTTTGDRTDWYELAHWAHHDGDIRRASPTAQGDRYGRIDVDTFRAAAGTALRQYQLRVTLYRVPGGPSPTVSMVGAMTSAIPARHHVAVSDPGPAAGTELDVPRYSQNIHSGNYPEYGGGGEVWCSPTATAMVLDYWDAGPSAEELSWIPPSYPDPQVVHAARSTYDYAYRGTGNWSFNVAYAGQQGLRGVVTRLASLRELAAYVAAGIPVITSLSFTAAELDGAGYSTPGHLMVVVGFTDDGDVITNDPAAPSNETVRRVYRRDRFETVWLRTRRADGSTAGSGGIGYLIAPPDRLDPLLDRPPAPAGHGRGGSWRSPS